MQLKSLLFSLCLTCVSCSGTKPQVTQPATTTIQTDAGEKLCEYVSFSVEGRSAQVGVCADNDADLQLAILAVKMAAPIAAEAFRK